MEEIVMKTYERPIVLATEELAEGVYAASGYNNGDCYTVTSEIVQTPQEGQDCFVVQCNANHVPENQHHSTGQIMQITFNIPVTYSQSGGTLISGDGTNTLLIQYDYHNNGYETGIGLGNLYVKADGALSVTSAILMCNTTCTSHQ